MFPLKGSFWLYPPFLDQPNYYGPHQENLTQLLETKDLTKAIRCPVILGYKRCSSGDPKTRLTIHPSNIDHAKKKKIYIYTHRGLRWLQDVFPLKVSMKAIQLGRCDGHGRDWSCLVWNPSLMSRKVPSVKQTLQPISSLSALGSRWDLCCWAQEDTARFSWQKRCKMGTENIK
jgi:hypothetical protein